MKNFKSSVIALALLSASTFVQAERIAITNATLHTATQAGVLTNASVVLEDGKIVAINPESVSADTVVDAQGKIVTPGFIGSMNNLGLVEVGAVATSRDAAEKKADMTFDPSLAFNPMSAAIAFSRKGGVTTNLVVPKGGDAIFKGQAFVANLSGDFDSVEQQQHALYVELGAKSKGSRAFDLQTLTHKLEDAEKALNKKAKKKEKAKDEKEVKRSEKIINAVLKGEKPIIVDVDRATDILALLALKKRFNLDLIIAGAADAVVVTKQLADANVTVIIDAVRNLPGSFDSLHTALDSAAILDKAGVKVILSSYSAHNLSQMRFDAGIAVANGLAKEQALKAITANISDALHLDSGKIAVGKKADLVMWSADPFEISSRVEKMWINGEEKSTLSRQDALRKRYTTDSDMPRAYTK